MDNIAKIQIQKTSKKELSATKWNHRKWNHKIQKVKKKKKKKQPGAQKEVTRFEEHIFALVPVLKPGYTSESPKNFY